MFKQGTNREADMQRKRLERLKEQASLPKPQPAPKQPAKGAQ